MKILLTINKTYRGQPDSSQWYVREPLESLGHEVVFYDTVAGDPAGNTYDQIIETFKPELVFCMLTGDKAIAPYEPWNALMKETQSGRTKTFNWFCDDTWRFDTFSKIACRAFTVCSTPERDHIEKYKNEGYDNIIVGNWHASAKCFTPSDWDTRKYALSFIGAPTPSRSQFFNDSMIPVEFLTGLSQEQLFEAHSNSQVGINLSVNDNDPDGKTQMKQRIFEVPASAGTLLTQYHPGIEEYYDIGTEILTFKTPEEFAEQAIALMTNEKMLKEVAAAGHRRFLKDHDSKVRLEKVLQEIMAI